MKQLKPISIVAVKLALKGQRKLLEDMLKNKEISFLEIYKIQKLLRKCDDSFIKRI